jgi:hypothetical protein
MNQSELIEKVAQATELNQATAGQAVKAVVTAILDALLGGEAVRVSGREHRNRSQQGSAIPRRQGRQGCPQSADCEGGSPEELCTTTKEIRGADVNILSSVARTLSLWNSSVAVR